MIYLNNKKRIALIWSFAKRHLPLFCFAEICIAVVYVISLLLPLNLVLLTDEVLYLKRFNIFPTVIRNYIVYFIVTTVFNSIYAYVWQTLNNKYVLNIKNELYRKVMYAKTNHLHSMNAGDVMSRIDTDAEQFIHVIQKNIFHFINSIIYCFFIIYMIGRININISMILLLAAALPIIVTNVLSRYTHIYSRDMRENMGENAGKIFELIKGIHDIKLLCAQKWSNSIILKWITTQNILGNKLRRTDLTANKLIYFFNLLTTIVIYSYSIKLVYDNKLSVGFCLAIFQYVFLLHRKLNWTLRIYMDWHNRKVSIDRVAEIFSYEEEDFSQGIVFDSFESLEFKNVSFSYDSEIVLENVSFIINKGEKAGLVGISGAGKTTIIGLILKLYKPKSGEILLNGINIDNVDTKYLRSAIGIVQQEVMLFDDSIRYNLILDNNFTDKEIINVCKQVGLDVVIDNLPDKYDTRIFRNSGLSTGQKQRILIARALLKNTQFFILDEATSSLDVQTEKIILNNKDFNSDYLTTLVVSHRLSALQNCCKTIVVNNGSIECIGSHDNLLRNSNTYRTLFGEG